MKTKVLTMAYKNLQDFLQIYYDFMSYKTSFTYHEGDILVSLLFAELTRHVPIIPTWNILPLDTSLASYLHSIQPSSMRAASLTQCHILLAHFCLSVLTPPYPALLSIVLCILQTGSIFYIYYHISHEFYWLSHLEIKLHKRMNVLFSS